MLVAATALLLLTALVFAQEEDPFMSAAAQDGMAKVQWALMALQLSQNEQVKAFAQQVLADYTQSQNDLVLIANQHALLLPRDLTPKDRATSDALAQLQDADFDKAYMKAMLKDRQAELSKLQQDAAKSGTPGIADWAKQTLPALQDDLKASQKIAPAVGVKLPPANQGPPTRTEGAANSKPASPTPY